MDESSSAAAAEGAGDGASYGRVKAALRRAVDGHQGRPEEGERARVAEIARVIRAALDCGGASTSVARALDECASDDSREMASISQRHCTDFVASIDELARLRADAATLKRVLDAQCDGVIARGEPTLKLMEELASCHDAVAGYRAAGACIDKACVALNLVDEAERMLEELAAAPASSGRPSEREDRGGGAASLAAANPFLVEEEDEEEEDAGNPFLSPARKSRGGGSRAHAGARASPSPSPSPSLRSTNGSLSSAPPPSVRYYDILNIIDAVRDCASFRGGMGVGMGGVGVGGGTNGSGEGDAPLSKPLSKILHAQVSRMSDRLAAIACEDFNGWLLMARERAPLVAMDAAQILGVVGRERQEHYIRQRALVTAIQGMWDRPLADIVAACIAREKEGERKGKREGEGEGEREREREGERGEKERERATLTESMDRGR